MPRGDGTGPMGAGPMTGRAAGYCNDFTAPGYSSYGGFGRGIGRGLGRGFGRGFGRGYCAVDYAFEANRPAVDEKTFLDNQANYLERQLQEVKRRLSEMKVSE